MHVSSDSIVAPGTVRLKERLPSGRWAMLNGKLVSDCSSSVYKQKLITHGFLVQADERELSARRFLLFGGGHASRRAIAHNTSRYAEWSLYLEPVHFGFRATGTKSKDSRQ